MKIRMQIIVAVALVVVSSGIVAVLSRTGGGQVQSADPMEGHDHSAMSSGADEAQPVSLTDDAGLIVAMAVLLRAERGGDASE